MAAYGDISLVKIQLLKNSIFDIKNYIFDIKNAIVDLTIEFLISKM